MAETAGEEFAFIVLAVIFIFVIVLVFSYFLLFGFGFTDASTCYLSSQVTNFFYNGLCITQYFCISSSLAQTIGTPPLLGCSPSTQTYSSGSSSAQIFSGTLSSLAECWYQYGANEGLDVLYKNPGLCGVININVGQNLTISNLTQYMQSTAFTTQVSCVNHTAQQACPNYQEGFTCNLQSPTTCIASSDNYFSCKKQSGYVGTYSGYSLATLPLESTTTDNTAANLMGAYLCQASQGCSFNPSVGECTNLTGQASSCTQSYTNFCVKGADNAYTCTVNYDSTTQSYVAPPSCTLSEPVNNDSTVNISYFDYLSPGVNMIYSYRNQTSGESSLVLPNSTKSISHAQLYILYLNAFTNSRLQPQWINLPPECTPEAFLNNYPTRGIQYECSRALAAYGPALLKLSYGNNPGVIGLGGSAVLGYLYGRCSSNSFCNQYIATTATQYVSTAILTTTGLSQCANSLFDAITQAPSELGLTNSNFLGRNQIYVCVVTQ
ncbi:MAG: hypothetical protein M1433_02910 [Candidatus Parvarchaeota archaeon]|nr:hypothetical protein [Candidatus Parvarchaeota archaeon]